MADDSNSAVYIRQDGTVTEDTIQLGFYQSEDMTVKQGFSITASKIGIIQTCLYLLPEDEVKTSNIERTEVTFGYRSMPYSPYHSETHEPSGYYDRQSPAQPPNQLLFVHPSHSPRAPDGRHDAGRLWQGCPNTAASYKTCAAVFPLNSVGGRSWSCISPALSSRPVCHAGSKTA